MGRGVLRRGLLTLMAVSGLSGCEQSDPTAVGGDLIPVEPTTVEVILPWSAFGESVEVFGGFGRPNQLSGAIVANAFRGTLTSRVLVDFGDYPEAVSVRDAEGTTRFDDDLTILGGRLVAVVDTLRSPVTGPVELQIGYLDQSWDPFSAGWDFRLDSVGAQEAWTEPGAGPVTPLATAIWDPAAGDSVVFPLDSAQLRVFGDTTLAVERTIRIDALDPDTQLRFGAANLRLDILPSLNPDTVVVESVAADRSTFLYTPEVAAPADGLRAGGAPSWRTVLTLNIPTQLDGPAELCAVVTCPLAVTADNLNHASLILTSRVTDPAGFQPTDSLRLDLRPVLVPERLPKSPLGTSFLGVAGRAVAATAFSAAAGQQVPITITGFIRALVDPEEESPPTELALLSLVEPFSLAFGDFDGPGDPGEPVLRLILTDVEPLEIR